MCGEGSLSFSASLGANPWPDQSLSPREGAPGDPRRDDELPVHHGRSQGCDELAADDANEEASNKRKAGVEDEMSSGGASSTDTLEEDPDEAARARRAKLLEDVPLSVKRNLAERRKREEEEAMDPHTLDFGKKQKLFEALSKTFGAPTKLQEGELRSRMENVCQGEGRSEGIRRKGKRTMSGGGPMWVRSRRPSASIWSRVLNSRFVLTNKGGPTLAEAELKARWIFGGHRDPDAGLYETSSPTASILGHTDLRTTRSGEQWWTATPDNAETIDHGLTCKASQAYL